MKIGNAESLREVGPEMPESGSKTTTVSIFWANLELFRRDPKDFLSRLAIMDKTWLYHYDPETKQKSMQWRQSGSTRPQKFRVKKSDGKFLVCLDFLGSNGILLIDYLPKGQTINAEYYSSLLV
jgi:hypothetical protein